MNSLATKTVVFALIVVISVAVVNSARTARPSTTRTTRAICQAFGRFCSQAIAIARCESSLNVYAHNGQYLGLFQMGSYARARYGHSWTAWGQARAAYRYFRDVGYSWSPWTCAFVL